MLRIIVVLLAASWAAPAWSAIIVSDMQARFEVEALTDGGTAVHLLAGGPFGNGGIAAGQFDFDIIGPYPPDPIRWVASLGNVSGVAPQPFAPEGARVVSFTFDRTGNFSGIEPQPFKIFMATPSSTLGELDFSGVTGAVLGSLTGIAGLMLNSTVHGSFAIAPFNIYPVPEPGTLALFIAGLLGLGVAGRGWRIERRRLS
jgi:hypothetical protein